MLYCHRIFTTCQKIQFWRPLPVRCIEGGGSLSYVPISTCLFRRGMDIGKLFVLFAENDVHLFSFAFFPFLDEKRSYNIVLYPILLACDSVEVSFNEYLEEGPESKSPETIMGSSLFRFVLFVVTARSPCTPIPETLFL